MQWAASGKTKWAKRLNLLFADESKTGFRFRLRQARRRRDEVRGAAGGGRTPRLTLLALLSPPACTLGSPLQQAAHLAVDTATHYLGASYLGRYMHHMLRSLPAAPPWTPAAVRA